MVYFIQRGADGPIKIGYTYDNLFSRLSGLQVACPEELRILGIIAGGTQDTEYQIHYQFRTHRIRGEWFHPTKPILDFIATHAALTEDPSLTRRRRSKRVTVIRSERQAAGRERAIRTYSPKVKKPLLDRECQRCHGIFPTREKDRYCHRCTPKVLEEMRNANYLGDRSVAFERDAKPIDEAEEEFYRHGNRWT